MKRPSVGRSVALTAIVVALSASVGTSAEAAAAHAQISGSGSSWSANAVNQWVADVTQSGLQVVFTSTGSAQGRKDFTNRTTDFAVSDIGYQGVDKVTNDADSNCQDPTNASTCRAFAYLPIVAGGTSFPYQLKVAGKLVRNVRLSGQTLAKIFTNQITNWSDPAITADMNGKAFPSIPIIVVVHSEGSGSTAQFTRYLDTQYPGIWRPYLAKAGSTEYFPRKGQQIAQNGSDGVINFLTSAAANGAIGYDEYSYALAKNFPVAKIENSAGYFSLPTQYNVAVALTQAQINQDKNSPDYLLQNLEKVYKYNDPRTYALSSYSYMIIPTSPTDARMTTAKRQSLADYLYYSICQGQAEMGPIGYSPLPINLVQASFDQTAKLKTADPKVDLTKRNVTTCNNPTFVAGNPKLNHLAQIAPLPPTCDKAGAGPCTGNGDTGTGSTPSGGSTGVKSSGGTGSGTSSGTTAGATTGSQTGAGSSAGSGAGSGAGAGAVNPDTGLPAGGGTGSTGTQDVSGIVTEVAAYRATNLQQTLAPVVALELLALIALPPSVYFLWIRRRRAQP
jgi:ABC-type phosphate transport system substrate-binding protein